MVLHSVERNSSVHEVSECNVTWISNYSLNHAMVGRCLYATKHVWNNILSGRFKIFETGGGWGLDWG